MSWIDVMYKEHPRPWRQSEDGPEIYDANNDLILELFEQGDVVLAELIVDSANRLHDISGLINNIRKTFKEGMEGIRKEVRNTNS